MHKSSVYLKDLITSSKYDKQKLFDTAVTLHNAINTGTKCWTEPEPITKDL